MALTQDNVLRNALHAEHCSLDKDPTWAGVPPEGRQALQVTMQLQSVPLPPRDSAKTLEQFPNLGIRSALRCSACHPKGNTLGDVHWSQTPVCHSLRSVSRGSTGFPGKLRKPKRIRFESSALGLFTTMGRASSSAITRAASDLLATLGDTKHRTMSAGQNPDSHRSKGS